jgi:hypothetical protein
MVERQKLVEEADGEEYLHKDVWRVVQKLIDYAEANPKGALYDDLIAMVFAFHAIEGYLNYLGEKVVPDLWRDEKKLFRDNPVPDKLAAVCERCNLAVPDYGKRSFSTVSELKKLRNAVARPKTRKTRGKVEYDEHKPPPLFPKSYLSGTVSHQRAIRARDDMKNIADQLHAAAREKFPEARLERDALDGIMSIHSGTTWLSVI